MDEMDSVVPQDAPQSAGFDYNALYGEAPTDEVETRVSGATIPSFSYYIVHFGGAKAGYKRTGTPSVRPWVQVKEGPEGTVGVLLSDDVGNPFLAPSLTVETDGVKMKKDSETLKKQADAIQRVLNKVARVGRFNLARPSDLNSLQSLEVYASQFAAGDGFDAIVEIQEQKNEYQGNTTLQNRIKWDSLRAFDDPAATKQFAGKTALEEARTKIVERNKQIAARKGDGKSGTAGASSRTDPTAQQFN